MSENQPAALDVDQSLDPRSVTTARLVGIIGTTAVSLPTLGGVLVAAVAAPWSEGAKLGLFGTWALFTLVGAVMTYAWPEARYRRTRYRVDEHGLTIRRGVVWRSETFVPRSRVQHTDVLQGPLQRSFELATLIVHTAGTQDASVALSGLAYRDALPIRDLLIGDRSGDDSV